MSQKHRGPDSKDARLFAEANLEKLRLAVGEFSWLLQRGYPERAALALVGDRHALVQRQRMAVLRSSCSDDQQKQRSSKQVELSALTGPLYIDGYNLLITVEAALGGAALFLGRDGCVRDLAGVHGSFRQVQETLPALTLCGNLLAELGVAPVVWYLDSPVSNSGRLRSSMEQLARDNRWDWQVLLDNNPDHVLAALKGVIVSADGVVLDRCFSHCQLAGHLLEQKIKDPWLIDLRGD